ncbi:MAG: hypothetical protein IPO08_18675 [Xanthomonadales bacterium]|nr:hypothetical protein [Xanthomonadales bacterium]MBK9496488.1 hypothetical protein [Xanthomonadales bacterium]
MPILTIILTFLGGWRNLVAAGLLAAMVGSLLYYVNEYDNRGREIVALERQLVDHKNDVIVLETNIGLLKDTLTGLNNRLAERSGDLEKFCAILADVKASTDPKDDEPVGGTAVPLTFERLKKMEAK